MSDQNYEIVQLACSADDTPNIFDENEAGFSLGSIVDSLEGTPEMHR